MAFVWSTANPTYYSRGKVDTTFWAWFLYCDYIRVPKTEAPTAEPLIHCMKCKVFVCLKHDSTGQYTTIVAKLEKNMPKTILCLCNRAANLSWT